MTYEEALQKINSRLLFGIKPGLERIEALCKKLGDPQKKPRFVHVGGGLPHGPLYVPVCA